MTIRYSIESCGDTDRKDQATAFKQLHNKYKDQRLELIASAEEADVVLATDVGSVNPVKNLIRNRNVRANVSKVIAYAEFSHPPVFFATISPNARQGYICHEASPYYFFIKSMIKQYGWVAENESEAKKFLFSFQGRICNRVRKEIIETYSDSIMEQWIVEDTTKSFPIFKFGKQADWGQIVSQRQRYLDVMQKSNFALCPAGAGPSSIRIYEALMLGAVPVIISDKWLSPRGVDWDNCSLRIPESDVSRIPEILSREESRLRDLQRNGRKAVELLIRDEGYWRTISDAIVRITGVMKERRMVSPHMLRVVEVLEQVRIKIRQNRRRIKALLDR